MVTSRMTMKYPQHTARRAANPALEVCSCGPVTGSVLAPTPSVFTSADVLAH
jgi:hypothetical protein